MAQTRFVGNRPIGQTAGFVACQPALKFIDEIRKLRRGQETNLFGGTLLGTCPIVLAIPGRLKNWQCRSSTSCTTSRTGSRKIAKKRKIWFRKPIPKL